MIVAIVYVRVEIELGPERVTSQGEYGEDW